MRTAFASISRSSALVFACSRGFGFHVVMNTIWGCDSKIKTIRANAGALAKGHVMGRQKDDANNAFRPSDTPLTEHEKEQIAMRKNLERLRAERLAREATNPDRSPKTKRRQKS